MSSDFMSNSSLAIGPYSKLTAFRRTGVNLLKCWLALALLAVAPAHAETYVEDCAGCDSMGHASLIAQATGYNLAEGTHTIFVVNLNNVNAWKFVVSVVDYSDPGMPLNFGEKDVTVIFSEAAPQSVIDGLNELKSIGFVTMSANVTVIIPVDFPECPSAFGGLCAPVVNLLQSQAETLKFATGFGLIHIVWNKLAEWIFHIAGPKLHFVVVFPDGSFEIYEYHGQGQATGFDIVPNASVNANGTAYSGGTFEGFDSIVGEGSGSEQTSTWIPFAFGFGGGCEAWLITTRVNGTVTNLTIQQIC